MLVTGKMEVDPYTSKETPMMIYLNTHAGLEQLRIKAEKDNARGPICMLVNNPMRCIIPYFFLFTEFPRARLAPRMLASPR